MNTDRELLELAAKAAGMMVLPHNEPWPRDAKGWFYNEHGGGGMFAKLDGIHTRWNPLADDGDAFRLAIQLKIDLRFQRDGDVYVDAGDCDAYTVYLIDHAGDYAAATRRAIVKAAASIGRAK